MKLKEIIRIFAIVFTLLIGLMVGIFYLSGGFEEEPSGADEEIALIDGTKFPIDAYIFATKKAAPLEETNLFEEPAPEPEPEMDFEKLKKEIVPPKYDLDVFPSEEETRAKVREAKRKRLLAMRLTPIEKGREKLNQFEPQPEPETDFGDGAFDNYKKQDKSSHETKLYRAITADRMIPAILINSIQSTLEGKVTAQIEDDIYSSLGNTLLIPKGSRAIGMYTNNNRIGENRLRLFWQRIITPHGRNIMLTNAQTADLLGNSGIVGEVDDKYWERYGMPLALSTLTNSVLLMISQTDGDNSNSNTQIVLDNSRQDLGYIMRSIIDEQVKIQPTITVQAGSRIFINPLQDIWFPEPKEGEIIVQYFNKKERN